MCVCTKGRETECVCLGLFVPDLRIATGRHSHRQNLCCINHLSNIMSKATQMFLLENDAGRKVHHPTSVLTFIFVCFELRYIGYALNNWHWEKDCVDMNCFLYSFIYFFSPLMAVMHFKEKL